MPNIPRESIYRNITPGSTYFISDLNNSVIVLQNHKIKNDLKFNIRSTASQWLLISVMRTFYNRKSGNITTISWQHSIRNQETHLQAINQPPGNLIPFQLAFSCFFRFHIILIFLNLCKCLFIMQYQWQALLLKSIPKIWYTWSTTSPMSPLIYLIFNSTIPSWHPLVMISNSCPSDIDLPKG